MENWEQEARRLRKEWETPDLWPKIAEALEAERHSPRAQRSVRTWALPLAAALLVAAGAGLLWTAARHDAPAIAAPQLLTEQALAELQANEAAYLESIDKLSRLAGPAIETPPSPLVEAYRERLALLDAAIAELRAQADGNPLYGHVQSQLAALYREKQETLQEVVNHAE